MIQLQLTSRPCRAPAVAYRFVDRILAADVPLAPLAPFEVTGGFCGGSGPVVAPWPEGGLVQENSGWVGGRWRAIKIWRSAAGFRLAIAGVGEFAVAAAGGAIALLGAAPGIDAGVFLETLLGPPLMLALALQGTWCLHASAVAAGDRIIAFLGESGHGKSTLAAYLDGVDAGAWWRLADDILPVALEPDGLLALPHFPQLKLPAAGQYPVDAPARLPLAAVYVIAPPTGQDAVSVHPLGQREAMQALIRHTVAARLFDPSLLAAHLDFCAGAAARIPVWRLAYPHRHERLPQVREAIGRSLSLAAGGGETGLRSA